MRAADHLFVQGAGAGITHRVQSVQADHQQDVHELSVAIGMFSQPLAQARQGSWQVPVLERRTVAQCAGFSLQCCHVVPGVVEGAAALEGAGMLCDHLRTTDHDDALGIGAHTRHLTDVAALDAVAVAFEAHQAGGRDPHRPLGKAIKGRRRRAQCRALLVPHLHDFAFRLVRMRSLAGQLPTPGGQMGVQLAQIRTPQLRGEQPFAHIADLVLDLTLLPAGSRRTRSRSIR
jgi:hypothetical protein